MCPAIITEKCLLETIQDKGSSRKMFPTLHASHLQKTGLHWRSNEACCSLYGAQVETLFTIAGIARQESRNKSFAQKVTAEGERIAFTVHPTLNCSKSELAALLSLLWQYYDPLITLRSTI